MSAERGRRDDVRTLIREGYHRLVGVVRRTPGLLALSLLLSVSLWFFVTDTENPTVVDVFPSPISVEAVNVPQGLAVANQLPSIDIRVAAASDRWQHMTAANFRAFVDLNGFEARSQDVPLRVEVVGLSAVRVLDTSPRTVSVNLEPFVTNKVSVATRTVGQLPTGYELGSTSPAVSSVTVSGPASLVALVTDAVADVNVTGLTAGVESGVTLKPQGAGGGEIRGVRLDPTNVKVNVQVIQTTIVRTVPLAVDVVGVPEPGYRVASVLASPITVQIQGAVQTLQQIEKLQLPSVDVAAARSDIARSLAIPLPPGVTVLGAQRATVTVNIRPADGSERTALAVQPLNVGPGLRATVSPVSVAVVLAGPLPALNALIPSDARVTVDVGGRGPGSYTLPVKVTVPEGLSAQPVQPETVNVTITSS